VPVPDEPVPVFDEGLISKRSRGVLSYRPYVIGRDRGDSVEDPVGGRDDAPRHSVPMDDQRVAQPVLPGVEPNRPYVVGGDGRDAQ